MEKKNFWNDLLKYSLLLGIVMSASKLLEQSITLNASESIPTWLVSLEYYISMALYGAILYFATKKEAAKADKMVGFSFGAGVKYMMLLSFFASIVVGFTFVVYVNSFVGYKEFLEQTFSLAAKESPAATVSLLEQTYDAVTQMPKGSILTSFFFAYIFQYLLGGLLAGLLISPFTKVNPDIFAKDEQ